jgi:hypothetical protein
MAPSFKDVTSESVSLILVSLAALLARLVSDLSPFQRRTAIAQTLERLPTGAEKVHCRLWKVEEVLAANLTEGLDLIMVEESVRSVSQKGMERSVISVTGSAKALCFLLLSQSVLHERVAAREQTMAQEEKGSEIANHHQLRGVRAVLKDRKMDQDPRDENSKSVQLSSGLLRLRSRTISGDPRCDQMLQLPSRHLFHLVMAAKPPHLPLLLEPCQWAVLS